MSQARDRQRRRELEALATRGGVLLRKGVEHTMGPALVRNQSTGRVLPCCFSDCDKPGDDRIQIVIPHTQPRFLGEKLVYIFCSDRHREYHLKDTPLKDRA